MCYPKHSMFHKGCTIPNIGWGILVCRCAVLVGFKCAIQVNMILMFQMHNQDIVWRSRTIFGFLEYLYVKIQPFVVLWNIMCGAECQKLSITNTIWLFIYLLYQKTCQFLVKSNYPLCPQVCLPQELFKVFNTSWLLSYLHKWDIAMPTPTLQDPSTKFEREFGEEYRCQSKHQRNLTAFK